MADIKWSAFPTVASPTSGDTLVGLHSGANYQFTGLTIPFSGAVGGTGVANTGLTITLSSGAVGKILTSDSSGNATWASPGYLTGAVLLNPAGAQTISTYGLTVPSLTTANMSFDVTANTLSSTGTNGNLYISPNGTGVTTVGISTSTGIGTTGALLVAAVSNQPQLGLVSYSNGSAGFSNILNMYKSRSGTPGSFVTVVNGDTIGSFQCYGDDGTSFTKAAQITCKVAGVVSAGVVPGQWQFFTNNVSGASTLAMTISDAQVVTLANPLPVGSGGTGSTGGAVLLTPAAAQTIATYQLNTPGGLYTPTILDSNGNLELQFRTNASAVNYMQISNAATGHPVGLLAMGSDANVGLSLASQGSGKVGLYTQATSNQFLFGSGASFAVSSAFNFPASSNTYTFPAATGTVQLVGSSLGSTVITAPAASQSSSLALGTAYLNPFGYDVVLTVYVAVTSATSASILCGVGPTNTPTQQTIISGLTLAALSVIPITVYLPTGYYALISNSGTITDSISGQQATPV